MKTAICYYSRHHGNTRKVLETMARDKDIDRIDVTSRAAGLKTDIPALWLSLKAEETPLPAEILAALTVKCIPREVFERCREEAAGIWVDGKTRKWYYALPVIALWAVLLGLLGRTFLRLL